MSDKRMTAADVAGRLRSGMTIGIGGWGSRRKPMALVREIVKSDLKDLTVVTFGGPDIGVLCSAGKVKRAVYAFVAPDTGGATNKNSPVLDPHFRKARQAGEIEDEPYDEG
ncbi:MAG TPA: CoA-transferase, partial [Mycobacteriales bacterium]|nr:CoA-transferase [Mycobacteriales bacterium]